MVHGSEQRGGVLEGRLLVSEPGEGGGGVLHAAPAEDGVGQGSSFLTCTLFHARRFKGLPGQDTAHLIPE